MKRELVQIISRRLSREGHARRLAGVKAVILLILLLSMFSTPVRADYPMDVQRYVADGEYYNAMLAFERMPKRIATTDSIIAAAQSAWALSLPEPAIENFERALRDKDLLDIERARIEFSRGAIEFQEGNPQVAIVFVERALAKLPDPSPLRGKIWLLWAESLNRLGSPGAAEERYQKALKEVGEEDRAEAAFLLAQCQLGLGHTDDALENFAKVPLNHPRTPEAIRSLALLSLKSGDYTQTSFWLETGRNKFPDRFLDSWVDYALVSVAARENDLGKVQEIRKGALAKYPPSDPWLTLLEAKAEAVLWEDRQKLGGR